MKRTLATICLAHVVLLGSAGISSGVGAKVYNCVTKAVYRTADNGEVQRDWSIPALATLTFDDKNGRIAFGYGDGRKWGETEGTVVQRASELHFSTVIWTGKPHKTLLRIDIEKHNHPFTLTDGGLFIYTGICIPEVE